mgnify:FL=1
MFTESHFARVFFKSKSKEVVKILPIQFSRDKASPPKKVLQGVE